MRWSSLLEPCGSHHDDARALKCDTSVWLTELLFGEGVVELLFGGGVVSRGYCVVVE